MRQERILCNNGIDKDHALLDDNGCISDCDEDLTKTVNKMVYSSELLTLNGRTKFCTIYFYYLTDSALALCTSCINMNNLGHMYAVRKHTIESYDAVNGQFCSNCRVHIVQSIFLTLFSDSIIDYINFQKVIV